MREAGRHHEPAGGGLTCPPGGPRAPAAPCLPRTARLPGHVTEMQGCAMLHVSRTRTIPESQVWATTTPENQLLISKKKKGDKKLLEVRNSSRPPGQLLAELRREHCVPVTSDSSATQSRAHAARSFQETSLQLRFQNMSPEARFHRDAAHCVRPVRPEERTPAVVVVAREPGTCAPPAPRRPPPPAPGASGCEFPRWLAKPVSEVRQRVPSSGKWLGQRASWTSSKQKCSRSH